MKKILLALLCIGATVSMTMAQTATFGYSFVPRSSEAYNDGSLGLGLSGVGNTNIFVMKLSKGMATRYAGGQVLRLSVAVNRPVKSVKIIAGDTTATAIAAVTQVVDLKRGWNDITLTNPVNIVADKEIFFGVSNVVVAEERPYTYEPYYTPVGLFYYRAMEQWLDLNTFEPEKDKRPLGAPLMGISGTLPADKAANLSLPETFVLGQYNKRGEVKLPVLVSNLGSNDIIKLEGTYRTLDEKNAEIVTPLSTMVDLSAEPLKVGEVRFVEVPVRMEKSGRFSIKIDKANGHVSDVVHELTGSPMIVYSPENVYPRTSVVEYGANEDSEAGPMIEDMVQRYLQPNYGDKAVFVRYCPATYIDGTNNDPYALAKGSEIEMMYPISMSMMPASMVDRQSPFYFPMRIEDDIKEYTQVPGWAKIEPVVTYNEQTRELKMHLKGKISADAPFPADESYYATVLLCENKLPAIGQQYPASVDQAFKDAFYHDHVLRDVLAETLNGVKLELNANREYDMTLTTTLKNEWKAYDMYVVAMINRSLPKTKMPPSGPNVPRPDPQEYQAALAERLNAQILNAYAIMVNGWQVDVARVEGFPFEPVATIIDGRVEVSGQYDSLSIYDMTGRLWLSEAQLPAGVYMVRTTRGTQVFVQKLICN